MLGLIGGLGICCLAPYNDFVLNNTYLVGNSLPVIVVMTLFLLAVLVNGPLNRFSPRHALSSGEMTVILMMMLVSCAVPGSSLLRYLVPSLVMPFYRGQASQEYLDILQQSHLPPWWFPNFSGHDPAQWASDPIVTGYQSRWTGPGPIPYGAWIQPIATWGIFIAALWGAVLSLVVLLRRQWIETERLAFPLAQVQLALIDRPQEGRWLNNVMGRRSFWAAFMLVFAIHAWNGCAVYWPGHFPKVPLEFDLTGIFADPPFSYMIPPAQQATLFFTVASLTYFLSTSLAFTLWFMFLLYQVLRMFMGTVRGDPAIPGASFQHFGSVLAYAGAIIWIGRRHWAMVIRQAFGRRRPDDPSGRYASYPACFWTLVACTLVMIGWLKASGMTLLASISIVLLLLIMYLVVTRIVAETGLVFVGVQFRVIVPIEMTTAAGFKSIFPLGDFVRGTFINCLHDLRESLGMYFSHGLAVADQSVFGSAPSEDDDPPANRKLGRRMIALVVLILALAYPVGFFAHLATEYHYASTIDKQQESPINKLGGDANVEINMEAPAIEYRNGLPPIGYSRTTHTLVGLAITIGLTAMRLGFTWWPIHPVGMVLVYTWPLSQLWFSILIGWLAKVIILRLGGSRLYANAKPFMIGLVVGESVAIGFWLIVALVLSSMGISYQTVRVLPI